MKQKRCKKCGVVKDLLDFYKEHKNLDGREGSCIECQRKKANDYNRSRGVKKQNRNKLKDGFKICTKCKAKKTAKDFSKRKIASDGLQCWCKECVNAQKKAMKDKAK